MMTLLIAMSILAIAGPLGWYGHKASLRIAAWGEGMNRRDRILCGMAEDLDCTVPDRHGLFASHGASASRRALPSAVAVPK